MCIGRQVDRKISRQVYRQIGTQIESQRGRESLCRQVGRQVGRFIKQYYHFLPRNKDFFFHGHLLIVYALHVTHSRAQLQYTAFGAVDDQPMKYIPFDYYTFFTQKMSKMLMIYYSRIFKYTSWKLIFSMKIRYRSCCCQ